MVRAFQTWTLTTLTCAGWAAIGLIPDLGRAQPAPQAAAAFDRWDVNRDGKLSREELPENLRPNFDRVDVNGDGSISREEHVTFLSRRPAASPNARPGNAPAAPPPGNPGPRVPDTVRAERDIPYANTDHARQRLDLYLPKEPRATKLPLVVFIHGGGWQNGDKAGGANQVLRFVQSGDYVGASIGYRLSGDAVWPAQIHDCKAAIRWLRANADKYGIDPDRIGVIGTSAGGHLVALLGTSGGVPVLEGELGAHAGVSSRVQCVVDYFGPSDLLTMGDGPGNERHNAPDSPESRMLGGPVLEHPDRAREASATTYVTADDPPFLILHGTDDRVVQFDQSVKLDRQLKAAGVSSTLIPITGGGHGGFNSPAVDERVRLFLDQALRGIPGTVSAEPIPAPQRNR